MLNMGIVDIMFYLNRKFKHKVCTVKKIKIPLHHSVLLWQLYTKMSQYVVKVRYESIEEFDALLFQARNEYCQLIHNTIHRHFQTAFFSPGDISQPMRWTQYDMIVLGLADFPEFIEDGVTGTLVSPGNIPALYRAILEKLENPKHSANLANAGRERVRERFSWDQAAHKMTDIYQSVLDEI